jgi:hypothetical protein
MGWPLEAVFSKTNLVTLVLGNSQNRQIKNPLICKSANEIFRKNKAIFSANKNSVNRFSAI